MNRIEQLEELLSEGLDLCVRAKKLDKMVLDVEMEKLGRVFETKCATPHLWVMDQYDKDLSDWEVRARKALSQQQNDKT